MKESFQQWQERSEPDSVFRLLFERSADAQLLIEGDTLVDCNQAAVQMLGSDSKAGLLALPPHHISPEYQPDGRLSSKKAAALMAQAYRQGALRFEWVHRRLDGQEFPVEVQLTVLPVGERQLLHVIWREISERKQAESTLRRSKQALEQRVASRTQELSTLLAVQQAITRRLDPDVVLQLIADGGRRLTSASISAVLLLEEETLRIAALSGESNGEIPQEYPIPADQPPLKEAVITGQPVHIADLRHDARFNAEITRKAGIRSLLVVPLRSGSTSIGAISVGHEQAGGIGENDERILTMLGPGAVIGLENARLYREEQAGRQQAEQRRRVAEGLGEMVAILNSNRSLEEMLEHLIGRTGHLLNSAAAAIYRLQAGAGYLAVQVAQGLDQEHLSLEVPVSQGVVGLVTATRQPVVIEDTVVYQASLRESGVPLPRPALIDRLAHRYRAVLAAPIMVRDEVYGALILYYRQSRQFETEEVALLTALSDQAALAIENARLRSQAEQAAIAAERSRLARELHDAVTQTLFSASLIAEVLPDTWQLDPAEGEHLLQELRQLNRGALAEMRTLLLELRPSVLAEARLEDLLRQLAEAVSGRIGVPVDLTITGQATLPVEVHLSLYRIAQEALNNVVKHARASRVQVSLWRAQSGSAGAISAALRVQDNGRGFEPATIGSEHLGLGIMRERAEAIGAALTIDSRPGQGTEVVIKWEQEQEPRTENE